MIHKDGEVFGTAWGFSHSKNWWFFMPKQLANIGAATTPLNCENWMAGTPQFCLHEHWPDKHWISEWSNSFCPQRPRIRHFCCRGRIEGTCSSRHCRADIPNITITFLPTAPSLQLKSSLLIHIYAEGSGIWNIITVGGSPCHAGMDFLSDKELGVRSRLQQCHWTKLNCSKSYSRLKYKQGNMRTRSVLSKII